MSTQINRRICTELNRKICERIEQNKTSNEISDEFDLPAGTIRRVAKRNGLELFVSDSRIGKKNYQLVISLINSGKTASEISEILGKVDPETIRKFARKNNLVMNKTSLSMSSHPSWTGGITHDRSGYELTRVHADSEYGYLIRALGKSRNSGYAPTHRIVMHKKAGRPLRPGEVVDHIDGNILNNDPENLRLFASNSEHLQKTLKGRTPNWTEVGKSKMTGRPRNLQV